MTAGAPPLQPTPQSVQFRWGERMVDGVGVLWVGGRESASWDEMGSWFYLLLMIRRKQEEGTRINNT